jgi:predicted TIM-barrel fold metal-dependent hydrolase
MTENKIDFGLSIRCNLVSIENREISNSGCSPSLQNLPPNTFDIAFINPYMEQNLQHQNLEVLLAKHQILGMKCYLGYYHFYPTDPIYTPFYKLAEKFDVPIIFHTGDTYSSRAKLKYSQPLLIDEVAVDFPKNKFVMAHLGSPWVIDAAEVIYKNNNVYADLSGWIAEDNLSNVPIDSIKEALKLCDYQRIMYGSDWPLVTMKCNLKFIDSLIPLDYKEQVFAKTAAKLFKIPIRK